jgi:hypothetical protein
MLSQVSLASAGHLVSSQIVREKKMSTALRTIKNVSLGIALTLSCTVSPGAFATPTYESADFSGGLYSVVSTFKTALSAAGYNSSMFNCYNCANPTSVTGQFIFDASLPISPSGYNNVFSIGAIPKVADASIFDITIGGINLQFGDSGIQGGPAVQYNNGVYNGLFFVDDLNSPNGTPLEFSLQGGTLSLYRRTDYQNLFTGFLNIGANGLTNVQNFTPPPAVPEPETYAMLLAGLGLIVFISYRRKNDSSNMLMAA